jgi:hypothetical protein
LNRRIIRNCPHDRGKRFAFFGSGSAGLGGTREHVSDVPIDLTAQADDPDVLLQMLPEVVAASPATAPEA